MSEKRITLILLKDWVKRIWRWLLSWKYFLGGLCAPLTAVVAIYYWDLGADSVQLIGLLFELFATGAVFYDLNDKLIKFEVTSIPKGWWEKLKSFPELFPELICFNCNLEAPMSDIESDFSLAPSVIERDTEERLKILENHVYDLHRVISEVRAENNNRLNSIHVLLEKEVALREHGDAAISKTLKDVSITGLNITGMGVWFLFCGVMFSCFPQILRVYHTLVR